MTDIYICRATINDKTWFNFTVHYTGGHSIVDWEEFVGWVGDPVEAMHILRGKFYGYSLYDKRRLIHIADQEDAIRFGRWLFEMFEKQRCEVTSKFMSQPYEEVLKQQSDAHVHLDYTAVGDLEVVQLLKDIEEESLAQKEAEKAKVLGDIIAELDSLPGGSGGGVWPTPPASRKVKSPY